MRIFLRNDSASKALAKIHGNPNWKRGMILQVLGAGTAWFDTDRAPLENTDAAGIPTQGSSITAATGAMNFDFWEDDLWLRGSVIGVAVEVTPLWRAKDGK